MSVRKTKSLVVSLLKEQAPWEEFASLEQTALINALLAALNRPEEEVRLGAAEMLGLAVAEMAGGNEPGEGQGLEAARNIMRRLTWSLNDESGAVGWGAAEAMAEIMARIPILAKEFSAVLVFQLRDDPGSPDFPPLVKSALRAVARIGRIDKAHIAGAAQHLERFMNDLDQEIRDLAAQVAELAGNEN